MRPFALFAAYTIAASPALAAGDETDRSGPISKFEKQAPDAEYVSSADVFDVERCLIDAPGFLIPHTFRQPDRPQNVRLIWTSGSGLSLLRVDLEGVADRVTVRAWKMPLRALERCAPRK